MIRICFVCHGNICRSPMAEFVMKDIVSRNNRAKDFYIESRATHTDEIWNGRGNPIYPNAKEQLEIHGIPFDGKRAQLLTKADLDSFDMFIGMDSENMRFMPKILGSDSKVFSLMSFAGESRDVSDPWYTRDFDRAYNDIRKGCEALFAYLSQND